MSTADVALHISQKHSLNGPKNIESDQIRTGTGWIFPLFPRFSPLYRISEAQAERIFLGPSGSVGTVEAGTSPRYFHCN